jgi:hypothetical protein
MAAPGKVGVLLLAMVLRSTARSCRCGRPGAALDSAGEQRRRRLAHLEQRSVSGGRKWIWIGSQQE